MTNRTELIANSSDRQSPQFRVLSDGQCRELYFAALECLQRIGVLVNHPEARALLAAAGARVEANRAYIPAHIIQDAAAAAPRAFTLWGRLPGRELRITSGRVYFGPGPTCTYYQDPQTGERRKARRGDAATTARLVDALPNLDFAMSLSLYDDVTPELSPVYEFADMLANTGKPVLAWANNPQTLAEIHAIAAAAVGGEEALARRPCYALFTTYESPLRLAEAPLANLLWAAERGLPAILLGGPTVGQESPVTGASALTLHLAAALAGLAVVQLKRRGAPLVIGGLPAAMDLRTARPAYGSPEMVLHTAAAADLARWLGLPFVGTAGATESKQLDAQAGVEAALQVLAAALSGAGLVHDVGFLDCADIGSPGMLVLCDEIITMAKRVMRGVEVNAGTIMLDLLENVGPGGHYMDVPESVAMCRGEIWVPGLMDRNAYTIWESQGSISMEARLQRRVEKLLAAHQPPPLPPGAAEAIAAVCAAAEERVRGAG